MSPDDPRHGTRHGYTYRGCRCDRCTAANTMAQNLYRLGRAPRLIDATGSKRRIQALVALGWTYGEISKECGRASRNWANELLRRTGRIREDTAADIAAAYERMSATAPQGKYRVRARNLAKRHGWAPPLAWDNIDDPNEQPQGLAPTRHDGKRRYVDEVVVMRLLAGEWSLAADLSSAERSEACRIWVAQGRTLLDLERLTGWATHRYYRIEEAS